MSAALNRPLYGASWGAAIVRFFANYATFSGRASRSEYWWWELTNVLITTGLNIFAGASGADEWRYGGFSLPLISGPSGPVTTIPGILALVYGLGTSLPSLAVTWRRLHDTDRSGGWFFLFVVPVVGWIILLIFLVGQERQEGGRFDEIPRTSVR